MPELPEVETIARQLNRHLTGLAFSRIEISHPKMVLPLSPADFSKKLAGQKVIGVKRRAKIVIINLSNDESLLIHLKMTGQLIFQSPKPTTNSPKQNKLIIGGHPQIEPDKYTRVKFNFRDGSSLRFNDLRKFGWVRLVNETEKEKILSPHGIEPLSKNFTPEILATLLAKYPNRKIKQTLLDQTLIAGLGNIYVDEACFDSKIQPTRQIKTLTPTEIKKLHQAIVGVLKLSIKKKGTSARNYVTSDGTKGGFVPYLQVYGRADLPCKVCRALIAKTKLAGRGTHFCPKCQR